MIHKIKDVIKINITSADQVATHNEIVCKPISGFKTSFIRELHSTIGWILSEFYSEGERSLLKDTKFLLDHCDNILYHRGKAGLILFTKSARTNVMNFLSENPKRLRSISLDHSGLPIDIGRN